MNGLSIVINYINSRREIVSMDEIKNIVNINELPSKEIVEIFRAITRHNNNILHEHNQEVQNAKKQIKLIQFSGYTPEEPKKFVGSKQITTSNIIARYLEFLKKPFVENEFEQTLDEISGLTYADQIITELLLYLYNEKTSVINMFHEEGLDDEDKKYIKDQIDDIDRKISAVQAYNIEAEEEKVEIPKTNKIALLRLPSGNIALLKDIEAIKNSFYNETEYYQDLLKLLEAIRTGDLISVKKLHGIDTFEDRNWQFRLSFSYHNGTLVITSLFVKKSNCDVGVYSTLKSRVKLFNQIKDQISASDEDVQILDDAINEIRALVNKRGGNNR